MARPLFFAASLMKQSGMRIKHFFPGSAEEKNPDPTLIQNKEKKIYLYLRQVEIKFDLINHHF